MKLSCGSQIGNNKELEGRSPVKTLCLARTPVACTVHVSDTMLHAWLHMSQKSCLLGALLDLPPDLDDGRLPFTILAMSSNICGVSTFALEQKMFTFLNVLYMYNLINECKPIRVDFHITSGMRRFILHMYLCNLTVSHPDVPTFRLPGATSFSATPSACCLWL